MKGQLLHPKIKERRDMLRAAGRCINGPAHDGPSKRTGIVHGPVVSGGKCERCVELAHRDRAPNGGAP